MVKGLINTYMHDVHIAIESILSNKLKSMLTALGIIFGVAAVISMLAIGNGAQQEILEQIKMVGVNNIIITPAQDIGTEEEAAEGEMQSKKFSPGLTLADAEAIRNVLPHVERISPEISISSFITQSGMRYPAKLLGVSTDFFGLYSLPLESGTYFTEQQSIEGMSVCVIGHNIKAKFFNNVDPIGKYVKFGSIWLHVVGVLTKSTVTTTSSFDNAGVNVYNDNVFIPIKTMLMRYQNRAIANTKQSEGASSIRVSGGRITMLSASSSEEEGRKNYHQLDRIIVQVKETEDLNSTTEVLGRMMLRRHQGVKDYEITVPELLLKQQQRTKDIFNIVLGAIAGISLLVGGIGIMNIMFASVMERIKEIGTRLAIGAKKQDIIAQFLSEAILISVTGGAIGVLLGVGLSLIIEYSFGIKTIISVVSVLIAFGVSAAVGIIFGYAPAKRAAERDPIESLRYE
ncbi:MAG: ABC transporter permease [Bacteroidales bacterium]|nr:ABC transporter permease [Bacteroidales bacterium]MCL2133336.1 ABC transporter permease [Bacteroidales bacterium]